MTARSCCGRRPLRILAGIAIMACALLLSPAMAQPPALTVRVPAEDGSPPAYHDYILTLLKTALERGGPGPAQLTEVPIIGTQDRLLHYLETDDLIDVYWVGTSTLREQKLAPVRVPLTAGLLGLRVPVILSERKDEFSQISTLDHLRQYVACQGDQWPDSDILEANGIPVLRISQFHLMYKMLQARRCDYFPRSLNEAYTEVAAQPNRDFAIDEGIILSYRYPLYFFTSRQNQGLNARLEKGLTAMVLDGGLVALMQRHPAMAPAFPLSRYQTSRIFPLANPLLPADTPLQDPRLWLTRPDGTLRPGSP